VVSSGVRNEKSAPRRTAKETKRLMVRMEVVDLPPCLIFIDKEGRWYHKGTEMIRRDFIRLFYDHMTMKSDGTYVIEWMGNRCFVDVEDTAFVVWGVQIGENCEDPSGRILLELSDGSEEALMADTLRVGRDNVLYCDVKNRRFPARFNRPAYYQLAERIEEENGGYYLPLGGKKYRVL
jgi:hypothetical protein